MRRLAAIMAADVVGYSRLMGADEAGTLAAVKDCFEGLVGPRIAQHEGRIVKLIGDGLLAEFASIVEAVLCAAEIQEAMAEQSAASSGPRLALRIGVNLGDVIVEDGDLFGDGVNIAARLEGLAEPGGVCLSGTAYEQVKAKVALAFEDLGQQTVKNIAEPLRVYRIGIAASEAVPAADAGLAAELHEKPVIAVLPFTDQGGEEDQAFFADGLTEDIITELSRFQSLSVIGRASVFTYKDRSIRVQDAGRELGVSYVLEGGVRRAGERVRLTVQLVDAVSGNQVWAERYDRRLTDIFELQDELTCAVVATLPGRLATADAERTRRKAPSDMGVYDLLLRAKLCHHRGGAEDNAEALRLLEQAIALDREFAAAYGWKACTLGQAMGRGYLADSDETMAAVMEAIDKGRSLDENDLECVRILCEIRMENARLDEARILNDKALQLNPNDPRILAQRGELLTWLGDAQEGAAWVEKAMRLDPYEADAWAHLLGRAHFGAQRYDEAIAAFKRVPAPRSAQLAYLAACCRRLGRDAEAEAYAARIMAADPGFTLSGLFDFLHYAKDADRVQLAEALAGLGLPG